MNHQRSAHGVFGTSDGTAHPLTCASLQLPAPSGEDRNYHVEEYGEIDIFGTGDGPDHEEQVDSEVRNVKKGSIK